MHALDEAIDVAGEWWPVGEPDSRVSGRLCFTANRGIELRLDQAFDPPRGTIRPGDPIPRYPAVHGITERGEAVTLLDAQQVGVSINFSSGGLRQLGKLHARILVFGAHLSANYRFPKISFRVPGLQVWLGRRLIDQRTESPEGAGAHTQVIRIETASEERFPISSIGTVASFHYEWALKIDSFSSVMASVSAWFSLEPEKPQPVDWFLEQHERVLTMISFLSARPMAADAIRAEFRGRRDRGSILVAAQEVEPLDERNPHDFFLSRPTISVPLRTVCNSWFELLPQVDRPAALARSIISSKDLWPHMEFLSLIQALEGLHRALYEGNYMPDDKYESVKNILISSIPKSVTRDHRNALKSRIEYGNQVSLQKRLGQLANTLPPQIRAHIFGEDQTVPRSWVDTRNYYTHWDEKLRPHILDNQSLYYANVRLRSFLRVLYAQLMKVPATDIERALRGTSRSAQRLTYVNMVEKRRSDPSYLPPPIITISDSSSELDDEEEKNADKS